jgi:hypothetical protein
MVFNAINSFTYKNTLGASDRWVAGFLKESYGVLIPFRFIYEDIQKSKNRIY